MEQLGPKTCYQLILQITTDSFKQVRSLRIITKCSGCSGEELLGNTGFLEAHHKRISQQPMHNLKKEVLTCRFCMCHKEAELNNEVASHYSSRIFSHIGTFMVAYPNDLEFQKKNNNLVGKSSTLHPRKMVQII